MGYSVFGNVDTLEEFERLRKKNKKEDLEDVMYKASYKGKLTRDKLLNTLFEEGVLAVYDLGMKHMYEYLKEYNDEDSYLSEALKK